MFLFTLHSCAMLHRTGTNGSDYDFNYEVELSGAASIHMVPSILLGISILGGELIDAQAYIRAGMCPKTWLVMAPH
jgi:hypothetical protein